MVEQWCRDVDLSVNPEEMTFVVFTRKKSLKVNEIVFYGCMLSCSKEMKYFGVYFNKKLCFKRHMDYCIIKARKIFWSCRNAIGKMLKLSSQYDGLPYDQLWQYSLVVKTDAAKSELAKLQRMICMSMTSVLWTTPTFAMK